MPLLLSLGTGYVYLVFEQEKSVRALLQACSHDPLSPDGLSEYYFKMASRRMRCKEVSWRHVLSGLPRAGVRGARSLQASVAHPASQQAWQIFLITLTDKNKPSLGLSGVRTPAPGSRCLSASFPSVGAAPCHVRLGSASPPAGLTGAGVLSACRPAPQASPAAGGLCAPCAPVRQVPSLPSPPGTSWHVPGLLLRHTLSGGATRPALPTALPTAPGTVLDTRESKGSTGPELQTPQVVGACVP